MSDKPQYRHTVEIVTDLGANALVSFLKKCSTWSVEPKVIKSEKVRPPIKIGDKFKSATRDKVYTVMGINEAQDLYWVARWVKNMPDVMETVTGNYLAGLERLDD